MTDIINAWAEAVIDILNTPILGSAFLLGLNIILITSIVRLCINAAKYYEGKEINKSDQMQMKIKAVQMIPNLSPEEAAERIADIYEQYLREENNNE